MRKIRYLIKEELEQEHLSVIRELGRNIGVKAPATNELHKSDRGGRLLPRRLYTGGSRG